MWLARLRRHSSSKAESSLIRQKLMDSTKKLRPIKNFDHYFQNSNSPILMRQSLTRSNGTWTIRRLYGNDFPFWLYFGFGMNKIREFFFLCISNCINIFKRLAIQLNMNINDQLSVEWFCMSVYLYCVYISSSTILLYILWVAGYVYICRAKQNKTRIDLFFVYFFFYLN